MDKIVRIMIYYVYKFFTYSHNARGEIVTPRKRGRKPRKKSVQKNTAKQKSKLHSTFGRLFELSVEKILALMKEEGIIADYKRYKPNSREDKAGKDFMVAKKIGDQVHTRYFGVTISRWRWARAQRIHPKVPQLHFPPETESLNELVVIRVLKLFE